MTEADKIIHLLATKHGLPLKEVKKIIKSQFKCVSQTMAEGKFESVRLPKFGIFRVKPGRLKHINNAKRKSTGTKS
jgi:nucleoid DNA-binding protein